MINKEELKFRIKEEFKVFLLILKYLIKEPYYEMKLLVSGYYNSVIIFYFTAFLFFYMWLKGKLITELKIMGFLVFITYIYMFTRTKKWQKYYEEEMIKGKEI